MPMSRKQVFSLLVLITAIALFILIKIVIR